MDQWSSLEAFIKPPYIVMLQSNGYIIFPATLAVQVPRHFEALTGACAGCHGELRSGRWALATSSLRAGRRDVGAGRGDYMRRTGPSQLRCVVPT